MSAPHGGEKPALLISACLLGLRCRYDGASRPLPEETLAALRSRWALVPVCPEQLGGLATPRESAERRDGGVFTASGADVTAQYRRGAEQTAELARFFSCRAALLKARSPSCGVGAIYDGSFTRTQIPADGLAAEALRQEGLTLWTEEDVGELV